MPLSPFFKFIEKTARLIEKDKEKGTTPLDEKKRRPLTDGNGTPLSSRKETKKHESLRERRTRTKLYVSRTDLKNKKAGALHADKNGKEAMATVLPRDTKAQGSSTKNALRKANKISLARASNADEERVRLYTSTVEKGVKVLQEEYAQLKATAVQVEAADASAFMNPANADKIRYKDIVCWEATRVHLENNEFIHANYVKTEYNPKRFICTQAPLDNTVESFWRMIINEKTEAILMLCSFVENDCQKCAVYYPPKAPQTLTFGDIEVTNSRQHPLTDEPSILVSLLSVKVVSTDKRQAVKHFQWTNWPDKAVPEIGMTPMNLLSSVRGSKKPIVVHCSAGIGRTGVIVFIEQLLERMLNGQNCENGVELLKGLRCERYGAIQNDMQYLFVYRSLLHYFITHAALRKFVAQQKEKAEKKLPTIAGAEAPDQQPAMLPSKTNDGDVVKGGAVVNDTTPQNQEQTTNQNNVEGKLPTQITATTGNAVLDSPINVPR